MVIDVRDFKKTFHVGLWRKPSRGALGISFSVSEGEIFGFLGPNGAGKTTTIKALLGLISPDEGTLSVLGHPSSSMGWRSLVGYLPEHPTFYEYLTGLELVTWFGQLSGLTRHAAEKEAKIHLARVGLGGALQRRLRGYSKGMLQRTGLAQALVGSPKLLILDEPMTGLDPIGRKEVRELILELRAEGRTVFFSTHILPDVEMTCDRVAIIAEGVVKQTGKLGEILSETTRGVSVSLMKLGDDLAARVRQVHPSAVWRGSDVQIEFDDIELARVFTGEMISGGAVLEKFQPHRDDLEAIFLKSLGGAESKGAA